MMRFGTAKAGLSENRMLGRSRSSIAAILLISLFAGPTFAQHIVVTREVLLEAAHPNAIARAPDGGYVIAGYADYSAWATKVDESGKVIWRHELLGSSAQPCCGTEYRGITFLKDGTVLLCGVLDKTLDQIVAPRRYRTPHLMGLLTRINGRGQMTGNETLAAPQLTAAGESIGLDYLDKCAATEDGAIVVGSGVRSSGTSTNPGTNTFGWLVALNSSGTVVSNKVLSLPPQIQPQSIRTLVGLAPGDFLMVDPSHQAIRFKRDGEIETIWKMEIPILRASGIEVPFREISEVDSSGDDAMGSNEKVTEPEKGKHAEFQRSWAYRLTDGSLALFGQTLFYGGTAAVEWVSADSTVAETKVFVPTHGAGQIDAVAPTLKANEFATVRLVSPGMRHKVGPDETRSGIMLTFLLFQ